MTQAASAPGQATPPTARPGFRIEKDPLGYLEVPDGPGLGVSLVDDYELVAPIVACPLSSELLLRADGSVATAN